MSDTNTTTAQTEPSQPRPKKSNAPTTLEHLGALTVFLLLVVGPCFRTEDTAPAAKKPATTTLSQKDPVKKSEDRSVTITFTRHGSLTETDVVMKEGTNIVYNSNTGKTKRTPDHAVHQKKIFDSAQEFYHKGIVPRYNP